MRFLKLILTYFIWTILSLLLGIGYMRLVLGPNDVSEEGMWYLLHLFYDMGLFHVGVWIGVAIASCFILLDVFFLRKKLKNNPKKTTIQLLTLLAITVIVASVHYILEKVIDVI
ncbi:hypothetical protein SAMN04489724_0280 [Algoriphagus locisalis]|uniref:Uncharacterized protein n=1 Tax=Algoriphagus locisalis TaxID=305507 RepID=A0A1I7E8V4_9BACT|nr:hypothetical protein [Algoriphagus locisalis]SFU20253.1 hypothetical protein SAMN04489724_0280 [Algoriphagus locisalis]